MSIVFGYVLMEIGLPQGKMLWALLGFNLGKLCFVAMVAGVVIVFYAGRCWFGVQPLGFW